MSSMLISAMLWSSVVVLVLQKWSCLHHWISGGRYPGKGIIVRSHFTSAGRRQGATGKSPGTYYGDVQQSTINQTCSFSHPKSGRRRRVVCLIFLAVSGAIWAGTYESHSSVRSAERFCKGGVKVAHIR